MSNDVRVNPLCCCEYIDRNNERNHLLTCCCNCIDFDKAFDRLICCQSISTDTKREMLLTFQDRIRIPWRGGAKQLTFDAIVPFFILPMVLLIASIHVVCTIIVGVLMPLFLGFCYYTLKKYVLRTKFFLSWSMVSIIFLCILFEMCVPLMEILFEENLILIAFITLSLFCLKKAKEKAPQNHVIKSLTDEDNLPDITEEQDTASTLLLNIDDDDGSGNNGGIESEESDINQSNICPQCRKYVPPRTFHCFICQACIVKQDHHNIWLDCCIGESNQRYFFYGCLFGLFALVFGSNLTLSSICRPFLIARIFDIYIYLPDDCSDIYDQFDVAVCFVGAIYAILMAICILLVIIQQLFFISKGITGAEWKHGDTRNRRSCLWNWIAYICCYR